MCIAIFGFKNFSHLKVAFCPTPCSLPPKKPGTWKTFRFSNPCIVLQPAVFLISVNIHYHLHTCVTAVWTLATLRFHFPSCLSDQERFPLPNPHRDIHTASCNSRISSISLSRPLLGLCSFKDWRLTPEFNTLKKSEPHA